MSGQTWAQEFWAGELWAPGLWAGVTSTTPDDVTGGGSSRRKRVLSPGDIAQQQAYLEAQLRRWERVDRRNLGAAKVVQAVMTEELAEVATDSQIRRILEVKAVASADMEIVRKEYRRRFWAAALALILIGS